MLGVGSFGGGAFKNAGDGLKDAGICGPSDRRGNGWIGRANDGVVTEEVLVEGEEGVESRPVE